MCIYILHSVNKKIIQFEANLFILVRLATTLENGASDRCEMVPERRLETAQQRMEIALLTGT